MGEPPYPPLTTRVSRSDARYQAYREDNERMLAQLSEVYRAARASAKPEHVARHRARGRLLPMERLQLLLDRDAWFLELCPLAGHGLRGEYTGTTVRGGVGLVGGRPCLITLNEATLKGGAVSAMSVHKTTRLGEVAEENGLPSVSLIESAGADLTRQSEIFVPGGRAFRDLSRRSAQRLPSVCVVFGSSTAGGAYFPGMSDYTVFVKDQAQVYLAGPPLVKMATGEETDHETLGGAKLHAEKSGLADYLVANEREGILRAREIVANTPVCREGFGGRADMETNSSPVEPPLHDPDELLGIASSDLRTVIDPREVIGRVVDGSRFGEFKARYGRTLVTGWAHLFGRRVGILANHGVLLGDAAQKGAQFIQLCNQSATPLLFFQNITGFMVGSRVEREGIIKDGAKLINAVSNSRVPAITLMIGASFGAGNYAMAGRAYRPRFLFTWPNHRIGVMGATQLAGVLEIIHREAAQKKNVTVDEAKMAAERAQIAAQVERESSALFATANLWDDGIIDPRDSRTVLGLALKIAVQQGVEASTSFGVFRH